MCRPTRGTGLQTTTSLLTVMQPCSFSFAPAQRSGLSTRIIPYAIHHATAHTPDNSLITDDITEETDDEESCGRGGVGTRRVTRPVFPWRMNCRDYPQRSLSHASDGGGASHMEEHACAALVRMRAWPTITTACAERCDSVMSGMCEVLHASSYAVINILVRGTTVDMQTQSTHLLGLTDDGGKLLSGASDDEGITSTVSGAGTFSPPCSAAEAECSVVVSTGQACTHVSEGPSTGGATDDEQHSNCYWPAASVANDRHTAQSSMRGPHAVRSVS